ncbi:MAG: methyltransferase domain-containing protein [Phycisphaerales bacterium]
MRTKAAAEWLDRADDVRGSSAAPLPDRTIYIKTRPNDAITAEAYEALPAEEREGWRAYVVTPETYHSTFYGTPIAYLPAIDYAGEALRGTPDDPEPTFEGRRVMDLGYGQMGQLELLAACGAEVVGVEVDPILTLLYADSQSPRAVANPEGADGSVRVIECLWPNEASCRDDVGGDYDVILARNLLKRGYVKPKELIGNYIPVAHGMSDEEALGHFYEALAPGGVVVIYSLGGAPDPDKPWTDIANPWPEAAWEAVGFEVVHHDLDVSADAGAMFVALGYSEPETVADTLFGVCSVYRKPGD